MATFKYRTTRFGDPESLKYYDRLFKIRPDIKAHIEEQHKAISKRGDEIIINRLLTKPNRNIKK